MPKKPIDSELESSLEENEKAEEKELEDFEELEETEESEPIDPDEQLGQQKRRIYDKIEKQLELSDFWQEVLSNSSWNDILRIYYRLNAGIVQKFYDSFTVKAILKGDKIEWEYKFYKDGEEVDFDALNERGVKE